MESNRRKPEYDLIRIIAMIEVIGLHTTSDSGSFFSNCVPLFVMLSGCLKLNSEKEFDWKKWIYSVLRLILLFVLSSVFYEIFVNDDHNYIDIIRGIIIGYYHLWYLYMITGLYLCIPILLQIKKNIRVYYLFWAICFFSSVFIPFISSVTHMSGLKYIMEDLGNLYIGKGFVIYFLTGDMIGEQKLSIKNRVIIYGFGIVSILLMIRGSYNELITFIYSVVAFVLLSEIGKRISNQLLRKILEFVSDQCLLVYIVHAAVIQYLIKSVKNNVMLFIYTCTISFIIAIVINFAIKGCKACFNRLRPAG